MVAWLTNAEPFIKWLTKSNTKHFMFWSSLESMLLLVFMKFPELFSKNPLYWNLKTRWVRQFKTTGYFPANKSLGRPHNPVDDVERILQRSMHIAVVVHIKMFIIYIKIHYHNHCLFAVLIILLLLFVCK